MISPDRRERSFSYTPQPLQKADIPSLLELEEEAFPVDAWDEGIMREELEANPDGFAVIKERGKIIAYIYVQVEYERIIGRVGLPTDGVVGSIAVLKAYRRMGLGEELLRFAIDRLTAQGVQRIILGTRITNRAMIALTRKLGFEPVGITPRYYKDGEDRLDMVLVGSASRVGSGKTMGMPQALP